MLRLMICQKGAAPCPDAEARSLLVSFKADTGGNFDTLKGFFGGYLSQEYVLSLEAEKSSNPSRSFKAYPLKLSRDQKSHFLDAISDFHWNYQGSYSFWDRNCVSETFDLLRVALPEAGLSSEDIGGTTPSGLLNLLKSHGLVGALEAREADAHPIESSIPRYQRAFQLLKSAGLLSVQAQNHERFASLQVPGAEFRETLSRIAKYAGPDRQELILAFATLYSLRKAAIQARHSETVQKWIESGPTPHSNSEKARLFANIQDRMSELSGFSRLTKGYGVPQNSTELVPMSQAYKRVLPELLQEEGKLLELFRSENREIALELEALSEEAENVEGQAAALLAQVIQDTPKRIYIQSVRNKAIAQFMYGPATRICVLWVLRWPGFCLFLDT